MNFIADLHTHTTVSDHAFSTLEEMARMAAEKGIKILGITNHTFASPDSAHDWHFDSMFIIPRMVHGTCIIKGCEANAISVEGNLDLAPERLEQMELVVASVHVPYCLEPSNFENHTKTYHGLLQNPYVDILGHPGDERYEFDYDTIARIAAEKGKAIEINSHAIRRFPSSEKNYRKLIQSALRHKTWISVASDAHISFDIGEFRKVPALLQELAFPASQVVNSSYETMQQFFKGRGKHISFTGEETKEECKK